MNTVTIRDFDPVNYLDNDEMIVEYFKATEEDPNPEVFPRALGDVPRAKGIAEIANKKQNLAEKASTKHTAREQALAIQPLKLSSKQLESN